MTSITIKSKDSKIITDANMLKTKAEFCELGFKTFPSELISEECPFKSPSKIMKWLNKASNVWHLRSTDDKIIEAFQSALLRIKSE